MKKYNIIYSDPPWQFTNKNTGGSMKSGASAKYPTMTVDDICALPIQDIAADDCVLFMWHVASQPLEAFRVVESWGFTFKTMSGFTWAKVTARNKRWFGMGFYTRQGTENCLIAIKGKPKIRKHNIRNLIVAKAPIHSKKPDCVRGRIKRLCGDLPRVELFARHEVKGWSSFGNEVENSIEL